MIRRGKADDAGLFYLTVTLAPLTGRRVLVVIHDHTAAIRLEQTRRDFVQNISHELEASRGRDRSSRRRLWRSARTIRSWWRASPSR